MTQILNGQNAIDQKVVQAKRQLEKLLIQFDQMIQDKTLVRNKSQGQLKAEQGLMLQILQAASGLDEVNAPEGTFGVIVCMFRIGMGVRDNNNELEYKLSQVEKLVNSLKRQIDDLSKQQR